MKLKLTFITISILFFLLTNAQDQKFIEVTGSAEMMVEPDEFIFVIGIEEYWKEEFEKETEFKDYKTRVPIQEIESQLMTDLQSLGIKKENIKSTEVGNYWRYSGKEFLVSKRLEIELTDFNIVNKIITKVDKKGIEYMQIGELKNKDLVNLRKEVKKRALLAAKEKADYLLEVIGKNLGDIISISEVNESGNIFRPMNIQSNAIMPGSENTAAEIEKKIKLRYEIEAKFEIK